MINLVGPSQWTFDTSGSGGFDIDVVAASGGVVKLYDPPHAANPKLPPQVFHYGAIGVGISTPGLKIPKLGSVVAKQLVGHVLNASGSLTTMWNTGVIYKTGIVGRRELTRADFTGACILVELGVSTPLRGLTGSAFLVGMDTLDFLSAVTSPAMLLAEIAEGRGPALAPKAVILIAGDTRGLVAGGTAYIGYMR